MHQVTHSGCDGSHRGLTDWYRDLEENIVKALAEGPEFEWTTGWYSSKHEIATACITCTGGVIRTEASVSDDFDTPGYGLADIEYTTDLDEIRQAIYRAWDAAIEDKRENEMFIGYSVIHNGSWVETYIKDAGYDLDYPPGDNYYDWGWQGEEDIPEDVKEALQKWADEHDDGEFEYKDYKIKTWSDE